MDADTASVVEPSTSQKEGLRSKPAENGFNAYDDSSAKQASSTTSKPAPTASTSEEAESTRNEASPVPAVKQENGVSTPEEQEVNHFRNQNLVCLKDLNLGLHCFNLTPRLLFNIYMHVSRIA